MHRARALLAAGLVGPPLFALVLVVLGARRPGYDHLTMVMSRLGEQGSPDGGVMAVFGFSLLGALTTLFALGLARARPRPTAQVGAAFLALGGLLLAAVGLAPCDPGCVKGTPTQALHDALATAAGFAAGPALLLFAWDAWKQGDRRGLAFTFACLALGAVVGGLYAARVGPWPGLLQRAGLAAPLVWSMGTAWRELRVSRSDADRGDHQVRRARHQEQ